MENILDGSCASSKQEVTTDLLNDGVRIEKIVSMGQCTDWMRQQENEWVSVMSGKGIIEFCDGTSVTLNAGDHVLIPAGREHRVEFTSKPCIWLCVFYS